MTAEEITNAFGIMSALLQQVQPALAAQQATTADLRQNMNRRRESGELIGAIRKGQMKEISPKKYTNMQVSGIFQSWAKDMQDCLFWHDLSIKEFIEYFDSTWIMDQKSSDEEIGKCGANRKLGIEVDSALHMVIGAVLEGVSKMLADTAEVNNPQNLEMHKPGLEQWRHLKCSFDRASARVSATCRQQ